MLTIPIIGIVALYVTAVAAGTIAGLLVVERREAKRFAKASEAVKAVWADVPDIVEWVEITRGNKPEPHADTDTPVERPYKISDLFY